MAKMLILLLGILNKIQIKFYFKEDCNQLKDRYGIETICVHQGFKNRKPNAPRVQHKIMICQQDCHAVGPTVRSSLSTGI